MKREGKQGMMKKIVLAAVLVGSWGLAGAQAVFVSRAAQISFYSSAPIEDIEAKTSSAVSALNLATGSVFFKVPIKSFQFDRDLMQSHFNSDYLESDKYPYAQFTGQLSPLPPSGTDGTYPVTVTGQLTMHGVTKAYQTSGTLVVRGGDVSAKATFKVRLADHQIKVPTLLTRNIAEVVDVYVTATYKTDSSANPASAAATPAGASGVKN
jgi:polyisoprenoid-binding protein YceI